MDEPKLRKLLQHYKKYFEVGANGKVQLHAKMHAWSPDLNQTQQVVCKCNGHELPPKADALISFIRSVCPLNNESVAHIIKRHTVGRSLPRSPSGTMQSRPWGRTWRSSSRSWWSPKTSRELVSNAGLACFVHSVPRVKAYPYPHPQQDALLHADGAAHGQNSGDGANTHEREEI